MWLKRINDTPNEMEKKDEYITQDAVQYFYFFKKLVWDSI